MIVRLVIWQLRDDGPPFEDIRDSLAEVDPPEAPGVWLTNEVQERVGVLLIGDDDEVPAAVEHLRNAIGREPDLYEEFDAL